MRILVMMFLFCILAFFLSISYSQTPPPIIGQFFGIWLNPNQTWKQKFKNDTPFDKLNRIYIAFGKIIDNHGHFSITFDGSKQHVLDLVQRVKSVNPTADIFLTVGGNGNITSYGGAANDPQFASNVVSFLNTYGFNGFDIDWEENLNQSDLDHLVTHLYSTLHAYNDKLTLDVWPWPMPAYDIKILKNNVDQINLMTYGTGQSVQTSTEAFLKAGFPLNKMIGGIETEEGYDQFGGTVDTLGSNGTISEKATYALSHGMAGMMEWRLDNDYADPSTTPNDPSYQGAKQLWANMNDI